MRERRESRENKENRIESNKSNKIQENSGEQWRIEENCLDTWSLEVANSTLPTIEMIAPSKHHLRETCEDEFSHVASKL